MGSKRRGAFNCESFSFALFCGQEKLNLSQPITGTYPVLGGFFASIAALITKSRFYYFCMDLYPEVGKISGDFSNPILFKLLEKIDNWNCKNAKSIIVHSSDMKRTLEKRNTNKKLKIEIINNITVPSEN